MTVSVVPAAKKVFLKKAVSTTAKCTSKSFVTAPIVPAAKTVSSKNL